MKFVTHEAVKSRRTRQSEDVILFTIAGQTFAIAASDVQEIRSTDSLAGSAIEINHPDVRTVGHTLERAGKTYYVVNACTHFGLRVTRPGLVLILRQIRIALLVDRIERMAKIPAIHGLPHGFSGEDRQWYRGLAYLEDRVIPVLRSSGFLTSQEIAKLDEVAVPHEIEGAIRP